MNRKILKEEKHRVFTMLKYLARKAEEFRSYYWIPDILKVRSLMMKEVKRKKKN
jgi:hypothetical protein